MRRSGFVIAAVVLAGCIDDSLVLCGDLLCPAGFVCDDIHATCVEPARLTACAGLGDGDRCGDGQALVGVCDASVCLLGCGDGERGASEECDDGNARSHDGCSSACVLEVASWTEWQAAWVGRGRHMSYFDPDGERLVVVGGTNTLTELDDQWTRDSSGTIPTLEWLQSTPQMPGRYDAAFAYDSIRKRFVVFGGYPSFAETWEHDGTTWTQRSPTTSPPRHYGARMVFDPVRGRSVMFAGVDGNYTNDHWEYDGTTWTQITSGTKPTPRAWTAMAWHGGLNYILLFGGYGGSNTGTGGASAETWKYEGATWTKITTTQTPLARYGASMVYMPSRGTVVMFGGFAQSQTPLGDAWEFNGTTNTWTPLVPGIAPPPRGHATLVHDSIRNRLVLVGGEDIDVRPLDDVWEFDGTRWREMTPPFQPLGRQSHMAYDSVRDHIVMYGGISIRGTGLDDTWTFDGDTWQRAADGPEVRYYHALAYDSTRERTVLYGGYLNSMNQDDVWTWNGAGWTQTTLVGPPPRRLTALCDDPSAGHVLMFGGFGDQTLGDTWELVGDAWTASSSTGPSARTLGMCAYDPFRGGVVLLDIDKTWLYKDGAWTALELDQQPVPRFAGRMTLDPWRQRVVVYGGIDADNGDLLDLWELGPTGWQEIVLLGAQPPARRRFAFAPLPSKRALVLYAGMTRSDTWLLRFASDTPDEVCDNAIDDDGDRLEDARDPDCL